MPLVLLKLGALWKVEEYGTWPEMREGLKKRLKACPKTVKAAGKDEVRIFEGKRRSAEQILCSIEDEMKEGDKSEREGHLRQHGGFDWVI